MNELELRLQGASEELFTRYSALATSLAPVHQEVVAGASATDGGWLTDHGPKHIEKVGSEAAKIIDQMGDELVPYEIFLLLLSIQVHDIANISGRASHENRIDEVWKSVIGPLGFDSLDKNMAIQIASTHGGTFEGSKSTLRAVEQITKYKNIPIRPRLLAAILKLADELAEEVDRASTVQLELSLLPKESEVYHIYSSGLHTAHVEASSGTIELKLAFSSEYFGRKFGKGEEEVFLLEEIYERTLKTWSEAVYCSRYLPNLLLTTVDVDIQIFDEETRLEACRIKYRLEDTGYPTVAAGNIYDICPDLADFKGKGRLTPESLIATLASDGSDATDPSEADTNEADKEGSSIRRIVKAVSGFFK